MLHNTRLRPTARRVVLFDAAFEAALAIVLLAGVALGAIGGNDLPSVSDATIVIAGCCLLLLAGALTWAARRRLGSAALIGIALANGTTAVLGIGWLLAARPFSTGGAVLVALPIAGLTTLSLLQLRVALANHRSRRTGSNRHSHRALHRSAADRSRG